MPAAPPLPDAETIRRTAAEVIARPDYQRDPQADSGATLLELLLRGLDWVLTVIGRFLNALHGLPTWLQLIVVIGLVIALLALVAHIGYTIYNIFRQPVRNKAFQAAARAARDPAAYESQVAAAVASGDFSLAVRLLFRACLLRLDLAERRAARAGATNREYLGRYRGAPIFEPLKLFVETIDAKWYGRGLCGRADYEACLAAHAVISRHAKDVAHAHPT